MAKDSNISWLDEFAGSNPQIFPIRHQRFDAWLEQHQTDLPRGPGHVRALRAAELDSCPTPAKPWLLRHHVESAVRLLQDECSSHSSSRFAPYGEDLRSMLNRIRLVPSAQRDRLDPVFQECSLWADGEDHQIGFDQWEVSFTDTLDSIDAAEPGGRGKFKRLYKEYVRALEEHRVTLTALHFDMLDALGGTFP